MQKQRRVKIRLHMVRDTKLKRAIDEYYSYQGQQLAAVRVVHVVENAAIDDVLVKFTDNCNGGQLTYAICSIHHRGGLILVTEDAWYAPDLCLEGESQIYDTQPLGELPSNARSVREWLEQYYGGITEAMEMQGEDGV